MSFAREQWVEINMGEGFVNDTRLEISSFGRVRAFNKISKGKIIKGSMINGYRIIRQKLFKPRDPQIAETLQQMQCKYMTHAKNISAIKKTLLKKLTTPAEKNILSQQAEAVRLLLEEAKKEYAAFYKKDLKKRTVYYGALIHRLVAENFIKDRLENQTVVAHLDHDKLNNQVSNLRWMTPEENMKHQQTSPHVIADKQKRKQSGFYDAGFRKLTLTKVMFLKKLLNEGKPVQSLAKQFKITETQVIRIKTEVNWGSVEAAK